MAEFSITYGINGNTFGPAPLQVTVHAETDGREHVPCMFKFSSAGQQTSENTAGWVTYSWNVPGTYYVDIEVTDADNDKQYGQVSVIVEAPVGFTVGLSGNPMGGAPPLSILFHASPDGNQTDPVDYTFTCAGQNSIQNQTGKATYTFTESGTYYVSVSAVDANENSAIGEMMVSMQEPPTFNINLSVDPITGNKPLNVVAVVTPEGTYQAPINYNFEISGPQSYNQSGASNKLSVNLVELGYYTINVNAYDNLQRSATAMRTIQVTYPPASFQILSSGSCRGMKGIAVQSLTYAQILFMDYPDVFSLTRWKDSNGKIYEEYVETVFKTGGNVVYIVVNVRSRNGGYIPNNVNMIPKSTGNSYWGSSENPMNPDWYNTSFNGAIGLTAYTINDISLCG